MPAASDLTSVLDRHLLAQLGSRLKALRLKNKLSQAELAGQVGISRTTLTAVEAGDPAPTMGSYLRVLSSLGVSGDVALLASGALDQHPAAKVAGAKSPHVVVSAGNEQHEVQDLQSLMMHKEAVRLLRSQPQLIQKALDTLDRWRSPGNAHAQVLWDEWSVILRRKEWRKALAPTRRGRELRQASPLPTILPQDIRQDILEQVKRLKKGVVLGGDPPHPPEGKGAARASQ